MINSWLADPDRRFGVKLDVLQPYPSYPLCVHPLQWVMNNFSFYATASEFIIKDPPCPLQWLLEEKLSSRLDLFCHSFCSCLFDCRNQTALRRTSMLVGRPHLVSRSQTQFVSIKTWSLWTSLIFDQSHNSRNHDKKCALHSRLPRVSPFTLKVVNVISMTEFTIRKLSELCNWLVQQVQLYFHVHFLRYRLYDGHVPFSFHAILISKMFKGPWNHL